MPTNPSVRTTRFALDLASPLSTAHGEIRRREGLLVGVDLDGVRGVGEATPLPGWTEGLDACAAALERVADDDAGPLAEAVDLIADDGGRDRDDAGGTAGPGTGARAGSDANVDAVLEGLGLRDLPAARHGLALALLDAQARARGEPLAARLAADPGGFGTAPADRVAVNATVGDGPPGETAAAAREATGAGFDCLKVKVGARSVDEDLDRLRAVREAVGDGAALRADANAAWDRETAARAVERFVEAGLDLDYVEQPLPATDLAGHADLRGRGVPVAVDESLTAHPLELVLGADAADVVVLKPMALGGPDRTLRAARRVRETGADPVVTTTVDGAVARAATIHVAAAIPDIRPCGLATGSLLAEDLGPDPAPVADGEVRLPDGPGTCGDALDGRVWPSR